ncbi:MAG TPA: EAL domain-containing protein [Burkholderiaceae bacterium]
MLKPLGPTIIILLISVGITLHAAMQAIIFALMGKRKWLYFNFSGMSLIAAAYLLTETLYYTSTSITDAATLLQCQVALGILFMPVFFSFVVLYTGQKNFKTWLWILAAISSFLFVLNFAMAPYSLHFSSLDKALPLTLPWGETLTVYSGHVSPWSIVVRATISIVFIWAIIRAWIMFRRGRQRSSLLLAFALTFIFLGSFVGMAVDFGYVQFFYLGGLSFLGLVIFLSVALGLEIRDQNRTLRSTAENLRQQVELHRLAEERIKHMAYHDFLTNLPNRAMLQELLSAALIRLGRVGRKGAVIMFGLDDFKMINDILGHDIGDRLLRQVSSRLQTDVNKDATLARLGGDEFILLLPDIGSNMHEAGVRARRIARKLISNLSHPFAIEGRSVEIGASVGIVLFPESNETKTEIFQRADMALYRAKAYGRGVIQLYASGMQAESNEQLELERDMRKALDRDEFTVYFQPQISFSGEVVGAEALLRWRHPQKGLILPTVFIPIAERSGLIRQIGDWVLQQACEEIQVLGQSMPSYHGHLSVNVSILQFMQSNYESSVQRQLATSGIDARRLMLEITESTFIHDVDDAISKINFLRSKGLRFSIDDFGTGYASLSYLRKLPVDELKIDQAFIKNLGTDLRDTHLVETIIDIAKCMGLQVVAEGVETESQRSALAEMNCWAFQGYFLAAPMDKPAFHDWLRSWQVKELSDVMT